MVNAAFGQEVGSVSEAHEVLRLLPTAKCEQIYRNWNGRKEAAISHLDGRISESLNLLTCSTQSRISETQISVAGPDNKSS